MIAHDPAVREWDRERMVDLGVRFGKALQMTNILRDVPKDLRVGRCYVPREMLESVGLKPEDLLSLDASENTRALLTDLVRHALDFYVAAVDYVLATPRKSARLRLAMIWPILIGLATLDLLMRSSNWLDPGHANKGLALLGLRHDHTLDSVRVVECALHVLDEKPPSACPRRVATKDAISLSPAGGLTGVGKMKFQL